MGMNLLYIRNVTSYPVVFVIPEYNYDNAASWSRIGLHYRETESNLAQYSYMFRRKINAILRQI